MNFAARIASMREACNKRDAAMVNNMVSKNMDDYEKIRLERGREIHCLFVEKVKEQLNKELPPLYAGKSWDDFSVDCPQQSKIKKIAVRYVETQSARLADGTGLFLSGQTGTGKTMFASILAQEIVRYGSSVKYYSSLQFLRLFREKNFESHAAFEMLMKSYQHIQFLILDEVTEGRVIGGELCGWEKEMLYSLVDLRYQHRLPTIFISNLERGDLLPRLGGRISSRLLERSIELAFNWDSYRNKQGK